MNSNIPKELPIDCVVAIQNFISQNNVGMNCKDKPMGEKVFELLEKEGCIVVFYPIGDEEKNDAFLLPNVAMKDGHTIDLIVINTSQTVEKQVFAAGHELGHLIKVHEYVNASLNSNFDTELTVNRFAAELLMPEDYFKDYIQKQLNKYETKDTHRIKLEDIIRIIHNAMEHFKVPYNSVVIRLLEVGILSRKASSILVDGDQFISKEVIDTIREKVKSDDNYTSIQAISKKRKIKGLEELLETAELKGVSVSKIERLRKAFGIIPESEQNKEIRLDI